MQRTINVEIGLNDLQIQNNPHLYQGDKNINFLSITFKEDIDLDGYTLTVNYLPPYPSIIPFSDSFNKITSNPFVISIPNRILEKNGEVKVEFLLSKKDELITVNKIFNFEVIRTINGICVNAIPEGTLKETIAQQIEKIKKLLAESQSKIDEYNSNIVEKTNKFNENYQSKTSEFNSNSEEKLKVYNDNDNLKTEAFNENVKTKTIEFDAHVNNTYLEMDKKATEYANAAGERVNEAVINQGNIVLGAIREEGSNQVGVVTNAGSTAVENIINSKDAVVQEVTSEGIKQKRIVETEGEKQARLVTNAGIEEISKVQTAGETVVGDINVNKTANIQAVTNEGTKQIGLTKTEGEKQVGLVGDKGAEQTKLVTDEGTKQITAVGNKGTEETTKVGSEGSKQVLAVQNQGALSIENLLKIQKEIEAILKNQEMIGNALALNGKSGPQYDKEIQSITGGNFDPDLMYLNDAGTKIVGKLYYDKNKSGVFKCIKETTSTVNSTEFFVDISSLQTSDRLDNLYKYEKVIPTYLSPKINNFNMYKFGKILFLSFNLSKQTLSTFELLIELPKDIIAKADYRIYCGAMLYFQQNTNIIKWSSNTTQIVSGTISTSVYIK